MRSVLFVAAALMIGASVYGFIDYSKTSRQKQFKSMYKEQSTEESATNDEPPVVAKPEVPVKDEPVTVVEDRAVTKPVKRLKKRRTVSIESFSRAPLREKKEVVIETNDVKAKENK